MKPLSLALATACTSFGMVASITALAAPMATIEKDSFKADANYVLTSSSTTGEADKETQSLSGILDYKRVRGAWGQQFFLEGVNSRSKDSSNNIERYLGFAQGMRFLAGGDHYLFAKLQAEKDLSSAYDYTLAPTVGYGRTLLKDDVQSLTGEVGVGGQFLKYKSGGDDFEALGTVSAQYRRKINDAVDFEQDLGYEYSESLQTLRSRTALVAKLSDKLSGQVSYSIKDADGDLGDSKDTTTSVGVRYTH